MRIITQALFLLFPALCGACVFMDDDTSPRPDTGEATQAISQGVAGARPGTPISSGTWFTCALKYDSTVWCWGKGHSGVLGDGNSTSSNRPVQVEVAEDVALTGVIGLTTGQTHACALTADGSVWCWGENNVGQLGDGTTTNRSRPVQVKATDGVEPLTHITTIQSSGDHTCALDDDGDMWCWGFNARGQLGDGTTITSTIPVEVQNLPGMATRIVASIYHSCAVLANGTAWCWGDNSHGALGDGTMTSSTIPVYVMSNVKDIAANMFTTCALQANGRVSCWGENNRGQVGTDTCDDCEHPVELSLTHVTQITMGSYFTCARLADGTARCWGANQYGQLGDGTTTDSNVPVAVDGLDRATMIAPGGIHNCVLIADGTVECWGLNQFGQLGDGTNAAHSTPVPVPDLTGISRGPRMASGLTHTCALRPDGSARCWGQHNVGQLGAGSIPWGYRSTPTDVVGLADALDLSAGHTHTCATLANGTVKCWGQNYHYMLGDGTTEIKRDTPVPVLAESGSVLHGVMTIAAGMYHTCALIADGTVKCWGDNYYGQLGDGTTTPVRSSPWQIAGLSNVVALSAGASHTCAIVADGTGRCWGRNDRGMVGDGVTYDLQKRSPVPVYGLTDAVAIAATGEWSSCALIANGGVRCWGGNMNGQFGTGEATLESNAPVGYVVGLGDAVALESSSAGDTICAIRVGGAAACWGGNYEGQCGDGSYGISAPKQPVPVEVAGLDSVAAITPGGLHTCALDAGGAAWCWGNNGYGQLGIGSTQNYPPIPAPQSSVINFP